MKRHPWLLTLLTLLALPAFAAEPTRPVGTLVDFRVEVHRTVANDLGRATAFAETSGADAAEVARKLKATLADGLATAKAQAGVSVKSGNTHTWPVYGKNNHVIEGWRMRTEIVLESRDATALSTLLGKLQGSGLAIGALGFSPAPETRSKAENEATLEAIDTFRAKADRIAAAMKRPYRIRQMSLGSEGHAPPPFPAVRGAMLMAAEAAPMPVEAGESNIVIGISGQIELLD